MITLTTDHGTFRADPARVSRVLAWFTRTTAGRPGAGDPVADAMRAAFCTSVSHAEWVYADITDRVSLAVMLAHAGHDAPASS